MYSLYFFNDTATTEICPLSLHDALPICRGRGPDELRHLRDLGRAPERELLRAAVPVAVLLALPRGQLRARQDRKSTRLNSSHANISYAVFCLKKKTHFIPAPLEPAVTSV